MLPRTKNISQLPVIKRFYKDGVESNKHVGRFYDMLKEVNSLNVEMKSKIKEHQIDAARALKLSNLKKLQLRSKLNRVAKSLSTINARIKATYTDKTMTASQKRKLIDDLSVKRHEIASDASMSYYEMTPLIIRIVILIRPIVPRMDSMLWYMHQYPKQLTE